MIQVESIIFDFGGVLVDWDPRYLYKKIFASNEEVEWFLNEICTPDWNEEQDGGRSLQEGTLQKIAEYPQYAEYIKAFYSRWEEMLGGPIQESVEILERLYRSKQFKLYGLTNWSSETFPVAIERYQFLQWFDGIVVSGQEGIKKPDEQIYQLIVKRYDLKIDKTIFIDDNLRNVKAAENMGLKSIHFQSGNQLKSELSRLDILKNEFNQ